VQPGIDAGRPYGRSFLAQNPAVFHERDFIWLQNLTADVLKTPARPMTSSPPGGGESETTMTTTERRRREFSGLWNRSIHLHDTAPTTAAADASARCRPVQTRTILRLTVRAC